MDETMIAKWNNKVPQDGLVFHLGDFVFGGTEKWIEYRERLNGDIILVKGNHDLNRLTSNTEKLFNYIAQQLYIEIEGQRIYLNHYPLLCYAGTYRKKEDIVWGLSGHTHIGPNSMEGLDCERMSYTFPSQYDVGVDMNDFEPISFHELKKKIEYQINNNVNMMCWVK